MLTDAALTRASRRRAISLRLLSRSSLKYSSSGCSSSWRPVAACLRDEVHEKVGLLINRYQQHTDKQTARKCKSRLWHGPVGHLMLTCTQRCLPRRKAPRPSPVAAARCMPAGPLHAHMGPRLPVCQSTHSCCPPAGTAPHQVLMIQAWQACLGHPLDLLHGQVFAGPAALPPPPGGCPPAPCSRTSSCVGGCACMLLTSWR